MSLASSNRYKVEVTDVDGNFLGTLKEATFQPFSKTLNSGLGNLDLKVARPFNDQDALLQLGNRYTIYKSESYGENKIYNGYAYEISRGITNGGNGVVVHLFSETVHLSNSFFLDRGDIFSTTRDGTYSADTGSLDDGQGSSQIKMLINNHRAREASVDQELTTGDSDASFGGLERRTQAFTAAVDSIIGVRLRLKYNSGTRAALDIAIRADNGAGKPTGGNLAICRVASTTITDTSYKWYNFYFDTPLDISIGTKYHIYLASSGSASSAYGWRRQNGSNEYAGGDKTSSSDGGSTWTVQTGTDFLFQTLYVDDNRVPLNYNSTSVDDTGDDNDWSFTGLYHNDALDYVLKYSNADFNYYVDQDNVFHYHPAGFSKATILDNCDATTGWTSGGDVGSITKVDQLSDDTTPNNVPTRKEGEASVSFALGGTATEHIIYKDITSTDVESYRNAGCWLLIPKDTQLSDIRIRLYSDSQTNYSEWFVNPAALVLGEWNWITAKCVIDATPTATSGTLDKTAIDRIALVINTQSSSETTTWYMDDWKAGSIEIFDAVMGRNISEFEYSESTEELINYYILSNNATSSPLIKAYYDNNSIEKYRRNESGRVDSRLSVEANMDLAGGNTIARNAYPTSTVKFTVGNFDERLPVFNINPGYVMRVLGIGDGVDLKNRYFVITQMRHTKDETVIEASEFGKPFGDRISNLERQLQQNESQGETSGDTPIKSIFDE